MSDVKREDGWYVFGFDDLVPSELFATEAEARSSADDSRAWPNGGDVLHLREVDDAADQQRIAAALAAERARVVGLVSNAVHDALHDATASLSERDRLIDAVMEAVHEHIATGATPR
jgi:NAD(P)-dependent dehydrogenase (short-subunit alcohol dehydrogenase family)